ncbi:hypothetical protein SAMN04487995_3180 [Dyadobacter koreensis]|uniref:SWIM-type domain-containing protein n=1 Tax=Dyadobacter koreensis TaxID=408657 RepID=A0A1H6VX92_9BACT|nr:hypothetical protein [Dyadobacter koreensis]SEJ09308.1 hypothetical protein SAMN04487995_3180 [Dyadobacter koreensis]
MNLKNFHQELPRIILQRGKNYYYEGAVISLEEEETGLWTASVEGSEIYLVEVMLGEGGEIDSFLCDCPHDADVFKHIVAVFYELKDKVKTIQFKPAAQPKMGAFDDILENLAEAELKGFVAYYASDNKDFKRQFELYFVNKHKGTDVKRQYADLVKKAIRSAIDRRFKDYYSSNDLAQAMNAILAKARQAIHLNNFQDASIIVCTVLSQLAADAVPEIDDSSGYLGDTILDAVLLIQEIAKSTKISSEIKEQLFLFLNEELSKDVYFDYGDFGYELFNTFRYLAIQLGRVEDFLISASRSETNDHEEEEDNYTAEYFLIQKLLLFRETGNTAEREKLIHENLNFVEVRKELLSELLERKDYISAKKLITEGIVIAENKEHPGTVTEWKRRLLEIAIIEEDIEAIRHYSLQFAFDQGFDCNYYRAWKNTFPESEQEAAFFKLVAKLTSEINMQAKEHLHHAWWSPSYHLLKVLAPLYIEEKKWESLYRVVESYPRLDVLFEYLPYLAVRFESELSDLFIPALILDGEKANSRREYANLAYNMLEIMKQMPGSRSKIIEAAQALREKYPKRSAMIDELKKLR